MYWAIMRFSLFVRVFDVLMNMLRMFCHYWNRKIFFAKKPLKLLLFKFCSTSCTFNRFCFTQLLSHRLFCQQCFLTLRPVAAAVVNVCLHTHHTSYSNPRTLRLWDLAVLFNLCLSSYRPEQPSQLANTHTHIETLRNTFKHLKQGKKQLQDVNIHYLRWQN